jgi:hypothetical protein
MANLSDSDRNTEHYDAPSDGPDGYRDAEDRSEALLAALRDKRAFPEFDYCIYCNLYPVKAQSDYCSDACAALAEHDR